MGDYTVKEALMLVMDQVDYVRGNCGPTEMVAAVLPKEIIALARKALEEGNTQAHDSNR